MIDYLYYKIYKSYENKSGHLAETYAPIFSGGLIGLNILVINIFLAKINILPLFFSNKRGGILVLICGLIALFYYRKKRKEIVFNKYSLETNKERIRGNVIVLLYIALSIASIFAVAFFRPGYLPN
jgi:hypothetical protein